MNQVKAYRPLAVNFLRVKLLDHVLVQLKHAQLIQRSKFNSYYETSRRNKETLQFFPNTHTIVEFALNTDEIFRFFFHGEIPEQNRSLFLRAD